MNGLVTTFFDGEKALTGINNTVPETEDFLSVNLDVSLPRHQVYFFLTASPNVPGSDWLLRGDIQLKRDGKTIARLPANFGEKAVAAAYTGINTSVPCLFFNAPYPNAEPLTLIVRSPYASAPKTAVLTPVRMFGQADKITFSLRGNNLGSGNFGLSIVHAYIGVKSFL